MTEELPEDFEERREYLERAEREAHKRLSAAISDYVNIRGNMVGHSDAYVSGWALYAEYINTELVQQDATFGFSVVPYDQHGSTTRGLFEFGADNYNRSTVRVER